MKTYVKEGTGYPVYTNEDDAITSHAEWTDDERPREHFGICELVARALDYNVATFYNAMRYQHWLHAGPPDEDLPADHWIRDYRRRARETRCPKLRYRITVEVEELPDGPTVD